MIEVPLSKAPNFYLFMNLKKLIPLHVYTATVLYTIIFISTTYITLMQPEKNVLGLNTLMRCCF